jgi:hypothetical protein
LCTTIAWPDPGSNLDLHGGKPATNRLSYGTAFQCTNSVKEGVALVFQSCVCMLSGSIGKTHYSCTVLLILCNIPVSNVCAFLLSLINKIQITVFASSLCVGRSFPLETSWFVETNIIMAYTPGM